MTRQPLAVEQIARQVPCPTCRAGAGGRCRTRLGDPKSTSHAARYSAATTAGRLPTAQPTIPMEESP